MHNKDTSVFETHIELIDAVNNSTTVMEHHDAELILKGFRLALKVLNMNDLSMCDMHYIEQGINRPMCCGVFLDWKER
jgi:hypothetical protein